MSPRFAQLLHHWDALFSMLPAESLQVGLLDLSLSGGRQVVLPAFQGHVEMMCHQPPRQKP